MTQNEQLAVNIFSQAQAFEAKIAEFQQSLENLKLFAGVVLATPMNHEQCQTMEQAAEMTARVKLLNAAWTILAGSIPWGHFVPERSQENITPTFFRIVNFLEFELPAQLQQRIAAEQRRAEQEAIRAEEARLQAEAEARREAEEDVKFKERMTRLGFQKVPTAEAGE